MRRRRLSDRTMEALDIARSIAILVAINLALYLYGGWALLYALAQQGSSP